MGWPRSDSGGQFRFPGRKKPSSAKVQLCLGMLAAAVRTHSRQGLVMIIRNLLGMIASLAMLAGAASLVGCNTMEGAGKDVEKGGEAIQKCADTTDPSCKR
jgi:entericidin B